MSEHQHNDECWPSCVLAPLPTSSTPLVACYEHLPYIDWTNTDLWPDLQFQFQDLSQIGPTTPDKELEHNFISQDLITTNIPHHSQGPPTSSVPSYINQTSSSSGPGSAVFLDLESEPTFPQTQDGPGVTTKAISPG